MYFINPYTEEEYKKFQEIYEEHLKNDPFEIYKQVVTIVFGRKLK